MQYAPSAHPESGSSSTAQVLKVLALTLALIVLGYLLGTITRSPAAQPFEFNTAGNLEGWTQYQVSNLAVAGGSLNGTLTGNDPQFYSPTISQTASSNSLVKVRYENATAGAQLGVHFITSTDSVWNGTKSLYITVTPNMAGMFMDYTFDMSTVASWTGTITKFRLDPYGATTGSVKFDYVRLEAGTPSPTTPPPPGGATFSGNVTDADGFTVPAGQTWNFDPNVSTTVAVSANVIVEGTLQMRPANAGVIHTLRFTGINEANFVGGGMDPVASDVGLWVMGAGKLDAVGTTRVPWNRTGTSATWLAGDEVRVAPTAAGDYGTGGFATFVPGSAVPTAHGYSAEVMNLTRNVRIEGTATGRTHVFIRSSVPQTIKYVVLQHMGPRKNGNKILGRWPLHFHMMGNASVGSLVEGVVIRDAGSHAFVAHASHGITFRNNIAYNTQEDAYWWDFDVPADDSNNITYDSNIAALTFTQTTGASKFQLTGFNMARGNGNVARDNVVVGLQSTFDSTSGFKWGEAGSGDWVFEDNVAHNNKSNGIFNWMNNQVSHQSHGFVAYNNSRYGILHGAYINSFNFFDTVLKGNVSGSVKLSAQSQVLQQVWDTAEFGGGTMLVTGASITPDIPVLFLDCANLTSVTVNVPSIHELILLDFVNCNLESGNFNIVDWEPNSRVRVQRPNGTAYQITPSGTSTIPAFYPY